LKSSRISAAALQRLISKAVKGLGAPMAMLSWQSRGRQAERVWEMEAGRVQRERESE
jgi:hypothetical protein